MADLFENIVKGWLISQGCFVIQDLKVGRKDIDILAVKIEGGKVIKGVHVEVQCSSEPIGYLGVNKDAGKKDENQIENSIKEYVTKKYLDPAIQQKIKSLVGQGYDKMLVCGNLKDEDKQIMALEANGVKVRKIKDILNELQSFENKESLITADTYRFQQMLKMYNKEKVEK